MYHPPFLPGFLLWTGIVWLLVIVFIMVCLSDGLSLMGACSRLELLLAVAPLGTSRAGDGSPPAGEGAMDCLANVVEMWSSMQS